MVMNGVPLVLLSTQEGVLFSSRSIETLYESLKVYLLHRSRQRSRIEYLLEEWSALQAEAVAVDEKFITEMSIPVRHSLYANEEPLSDSYSFCTSLSRKPHILATLQPGLWKKRFF